MTITKRCDACVGIARLMGILAVAYLIITLLLYSQSGALMLLVVGTIGTVAFFLLALKTYKYNTRCSHAVDVLIYERFD